MKTHTWLTGTVMQSPRQSRHLKEGILKHHRLHSSGAGPTVSLLELKLLGCKLQPHYLSQESRLRICQQH